MNDERLQALKTSAEYFVGCDDIVTDQQAQAVLELVAEVARLRAALEFYADIKNWKKRLDRAWPNAIEDDRGNVARRALEGEKEE